MPESSWTIYAPGQWVMFAAGWSRGWYWGSLHDPGPGPTMGDARSGRQHVTRAPEFTSFGEGSEIWEVEGLDVGHSVPAKPGLHHDPFLAQWATTNEIRFLERIPTWRAYGPHGSLIDPVANRLAAVGWTEARALATAPALSSAVPDWYDWPEGVDARSRDDIQLLRDILAFGDGSRRAREHRRRSTRRTLAESQVDAGRRNAFKAFSRGMAAAAEHASPLPGVFRPVENQEPRVDFTLTDPIWLAARRNLAFFAQTWSGQDDLTPEERTALHAGLAELVRILGR